MYPILDFALRRIVCAAFTIFCVTLARADGWILTYDATDVVTIESPDGAEPSRTETRKYFQSIVLSEHTLVVEDERRAIFYDFDRRRTVDLDLASKTYREWSLFSLPDLLHAELMNRNALGAATRAGRIDQVAKFFDRFNCETELRVKSRSHPANSPDPVIEQSALNPGIDFHCEGRKAVRFVPADVRLPAELHHRFVNYLAYSCAIHPRIRDAISATRAIPQELIFTSRASNRETTTTLRLNSSRKSDADSSRLPVGARPAEVTNDPVYQLLEHVREAERRGQRPTRSDAIAFAQSRIDSGDNLDGLMALLEYGLQSGEQLTDEIRRHRKIFEHDAPCQRYLKAFDQSSKAASEQGLAINSAIVRTNLQKAYMLDLQRANHLDRLGKSDEALQEYIKVIRANPFHAGALHDLGMLLTRRYSQPTAWACWDTARRLYPAHPMFKDVTEREERLRAENPDFF
jgi:tetratricopeptide (TPR) repeat protein